MLETCPLCGDMLRNGKDGKQYIEYDPEYRAKFEAGEITLDELSEHITVYYDRDRLCFHEGNQNTYTDEEGNVHLSNPPCQNYYAIRGGTIDNPDVVVEKIKMVDN